MRIVRISRAHFDGRTMMLHFHATAVLGACVTTIVSSIRLAAQPRNDTAMRWAVMQRLKDVAV